MDTINNEIISIEATVSQRNLPVNTLQQSYSDVDLFNAENVDNTINEMNQSGKISTNPYKFLFLFL